MTAIVTEWERTRQLTRHMTTRRSPPPNEKRDTRRNCHIVTRRSSSRIHVHENVTVTKNSRTPSPNDKERDNLDTRPLVGHRHRMKNATLVEIVT